MSFFNGPVYSNKKLKHWVFMISEFSILVCWLSVSLFYSLIAKCAEAYMDGFIFEELFLKTCIDESAIESQEISSKCFLTSA